MEKTDRITIKKNTETFEKNNYKGRDTIAQVVWHFLPISFFNLVFYKA